MKNLFTVLVGFTMLIAANAAPASVNARKTGEAKRAHDMSNIFNPVDGSAKAVTRPFGDSTKDGKSAYSDYADAADSKEVLGVKAKRGQDMSNTLRPVVEGGKVDDVPFVYPSKAGESAYSDYADAADAKEVLGEK